MLIASIRWYPKYSNRFSKMLKYEIKLKTSVCITNLVGKILLITAEHSRLNKPTPICNTNCKKDNMVL